jgi:hypothetical protein
MVVQEAGSEAAVALLGRDHRFPAKVAWSRGLAERFSAQKTETGRQETVGDHRGDGLARIRAGQLAARRLSVVPCSAIGRGRSGSAGLDWPG